MRLVQLLVSALVVAVLSACGDAPPDAPAEDHKALIDILTAAFNERDPERLEPVVAADFVKHGVPGRGAAVFARTIAMFERAFPSMRITPQIVMAEDDLVAVYYSATGRQEGPFLDIPAQGRKVSTTAMDIFRVADGKLAEQWAVADVFGMVQQMTGPAPRSGEKAALPVEVVARFDPPVFLESLAFGTGGDLFVTDLWGAKIYRIDADGGKAPFFEAPLAEGPGLRGLFCLVADADGALYVTVNSPDPQQHGVWRIEPDGTGAPVAVLPPGTVGNGIAWGSQSRLLVADSGRGRIFRIDPASGDAEVWLDHPLIHARPYVGQFPPANGVQVNGDDVYVANSDQGRMVRVPMLADGGAGEPEVAADELGGDDFAVAGDGTLYVTTHPFNTVVRVTPAGERSMIAGAEQGVVGPSAAVLREVDGERYLYVTTDGGFYNKPGDPPIPPAEQTPGVFRIRLD